MIRKDKKTKKYLGTRTRGAGNTKNRRGAGSKGGKGRTGKWKHKKTKYLHEIGSKIKQKSKSVERAITLLNLNTYIENLIKSGKIDEKNIVLDFAEDEYLKNYDKVVAKGDINYKVVLKNVKYSKGAEEKVKAKGGAFE